jgi:hypothetical protein
MFVRYMWGQAEQFNRQFVLQATQKKLFSVLEIGWYEGQINLETGLIIGVHTRWSNKPRKDGGYWAITDRQKDGGGGVRRSEEGERGREKGEREGERGNFTLHEAVTHFLCWFLLLLFSICLLWFSLYSFRFFHNFFFFFCLPSTRSAISPVRPKQKGLQNLEFALYGIRNISICNTNKCSCLYRASMTIKTLYYPTDEQIFNS